MSVHSGIISDVSPLCAAWICVFYMEVSEIDELDADWLTSLVTSMGSLLRAKAAAASLMMSVLPSLVIDIWHCMWHASSHPHVSHETDYLEKLQGICVKGEACCQWLDHEGWGALFYRVHISSLSFLNCFDTVAWRKKAHPACKNLPLFSPAVLFWWSLLTHCGVTVSKNAR